jgi:hypothetical protein
MSYLPGTLPADPGPLARFLPPLEEGIVARWLQENLASGGSTKDFSTTKSPAWLLDPFGSAPRLALEAARAGYRILVTIHHPLFFFLYQTLADPPAESDFSAALAGLAAARKGDERLELHLAQLYRTTCPSCERAISAESYLWRKGEKAPAAIRYACPHCGQRGEQPPAPSDLELLARLQATDGLHRARALERVVPLNDPQRPLVEEALTHYLPRPLYVLSTLTNRLQSLNLPPRRRQALIALLISLCDLGNDLWALSGERPRPRQLSTPSQFLEHNLWQEIENAISQWVSHAAPVPVTIWPELPPPEGGLCLFRGRVRDFARQEGPRPPFQAAIAALPRPNQAFWTLSALWVGWIWGAEAVAPLKRLLERRRYDWAWNMEALRAALGHVFRLLPAGAPFFALLAEPEAAALTAALCAAQSASFKLRELALRTPHDAVQITWERAAAPLAAHPAEGVRLQEVLQGFLRQRGEPAPYFHLQAAALCALEKENALVISPSSETEPALKTIHLHIQKAVQDTCQHWSAHESPESGLWGLNTPPGADSLADRVERLLVQFLQKHPQVTFLEVEDALYPQFDGLQTPSRGLLYAVLTSYAERREGLWYLRPEDTASARRAALKEMARQLEQLGERLRYVNRWVDGSTLLWMEEERVEVLIRLQASAQCGWLAAAPAAPRRLLVIPGGRVGLLMYKSGRDPRLATLLGAWSILKFRRLRLMQELPLLTRETFEEQLRLDPPEHALNQMMLF